MMSTKPILIAEDDHLLLKILKDRFEEEGFSVITAKNGQEALDQIAKHQPCVVLLDLLMPIKDGFEVLKELKQKNIDQSVVVFTNLPEDKNREMVLKLGAKEYYEKEDINIEDLIDIMKQFGC